MKCKKHPKYKALKHPRVLCRACWEQWCDKQLKISQESEAYFQKLLKEQK